MSAWDMFWLTMSVLGWWTIASIALALGIGWSHHRLERRRETYSYEYVAGSYIKEEEGL